MREKFLAVRLSRIEKRRLEKEARRLGCPISDLVRWCLRQQLGADSQKASKEMSQVAQ